MDGETTWRKTSAGGLQTCPQTGAVAIDVCNTKTMYLGLFGPRCSLCVSVAVCPSIFQPFPVLSLASL